jgi:hypothetical protein
MAVDLQKFKKAFVGKLSNPLYTVERAVALAELKYVEGLIKSLTDQKKAKQYATQVAELHKQFKEADKLGDKKPGDALKGMKVVVDGAKKLQKTVQVDADAQYEKIKEALLKGGEPNKADLAALAKMPTKSRKGSRLDELISVMPENTPQKVFTAAIEARFGQKVNVYKQLYTTDKDGKQVELPESKWTKEDPKTPNKSMKRIYLMMTKVPESHANAKENKSFKKIVHFTQEDEGGYYWDRGVYMTSSRDFGVGTQNQSEEIATGITANNKQMFADKRDPDCEPQNTDVETSYFDWATLHEVGHSVDDKFGFMEKYKKSPEYGGWKIMSLKEVAKVAAAKFRCQQGYVEKKLGGAKEVTDARLIAEFAGADGKKLQKQVDDWCAEVISGNVWWDGAKSKRIAAAIGDGRVYQKAYEWQWNSYDYAARSKGIHGYQFRAQYEWFAELYAAYYSDKLKPAHPAVKWLRELEAPKKK